VTATDPLTIAVRNLQTAIDTTGARSSQVHAACAQITETAKGTSPEQRRAAGIAGWQPGSAA
jgi:hypothetical protein